MKAIVSVLGKDKKGIIAHVSTALYKMGINIEDISQTIMQKHFTMIMVVSLEECKLDFAEISNNLKKLSKKIKVEINIQAESIFTHMNRLDDNANK